MSLDAFNEENLLLLTQKWAGPRGWSRLMFPPLRTYWKKPINSNKQQKGANTNQLLFFFHCKLFNKQRKKISINLDGILVLTKWKSISTGRQVRKLLQVTEKFQWHRLLCVGRLAVFFWKKISNCLRHFLHPKKLKSCYHHPLLLCSSVYLVHFCRRRCRSKKVLGSGARPTLEISRAATYQTR
jgi:predicted acetyltransferase